MTILGAVLRAECEKPRLLGEEVGDVVAREAAALLLALQELELSPAVAAAADAAGAGPAFRAAELALQRCFAPLDAAHVRATLGLFPADVLLPASLLAMAWRMPQARCDQARTPSGTTRPTCPARQPEELSHVSSEAA